MSSFAGLRKLMKIFHSSSLPFLEEQGFQSILSLIPQRQISQVHENKSIKALSTDPPICLLLASLFPMQRPPSQSFVYICDHTLRTHPDFLFSPLLQLNYIFCVKFIRALHNHVYTLLWMNTASST